jgi:hypothetical protein
MQPVFSEAVGRIGSMGHSLSAIRAWQKQRLDRGFDGVTRGSIVTPKIDPAGAVHEQPSGRTQVIDP